MSMPIEARATVALPTRADLLTRGCFVARMWWLWVWTKAVPDTFWFVVWPLVDKRGEGVSITRLLVVSYTVMLWHILESPPSSHAITANMLWLALASVAAGFGKSTFSFFLSKVALQSATTVTETTHTDVAALVGAMRDRRTAAASEGAEATR